MSQLSIISPLSSEIAEFKFSVKDHLVTGENFDLFYDAKWDMYLTYPVPNNLDKYYQSENYQPHQLYHKSFFNSVYNFVRTLNYKYKYKLIKSFAPNADSILDYGTATGEFLAYLQKKGFHIAGVEPNASARKQANKSLNNTVKGALDNINGQYDIISLWHVLEHVKDPVHLLKSMDKLLTPDGILVVAVPNFKSYDAQYYGKHWAAFDVPRHLWHFSPHAINKLFMQQGFTLLGQKPLLFDSFYVSLLSEKYKTNRKNYFNAFFRGLLSNNKARKSGQYSSVIYFFKKS